MANVKKKQTREERLEKKRQAEKLRYQRIKNDPVKNAELKEKERQQYIKKKEKGQIKSINDMTEREQRAVRKIWREKTKKHRDRVKLQSTRNYPVTPPASDNEDQPPLPQNNIALAAKRRSEIQRKLRNQLIKKQKFEIKQLRQKTTSPVPLNMTTPDSNTFEQIHASIPKAQPQKSDNLQFQINEEIQVKQEVDEDNHEPDLAQDSREDEKPVIKPPLPAPPGYAPDHQWNSFDEFERHLVHAPHVLSHYTGFKNIKEYYELLLSIEHHLIDLDGISKSQQLFTVLTKLHLDIDAFQFDPYKFPAVYVTIVSGLYGFCRTSWFRKFLKCPIEIPDPISRLLNGKIKDGTRIVVLDALKLYVKSNVKASSYVSYLVGYNLAGNVFFLSEPYKSVYSFWSVVSNSGIFDVIGKNAIFMYKYNRRCYVMSVEDFYNMVEVMRCGELIEDNEVKNIINTIRTNLTTKFKVLTEEFPSYMIRCELDLNFFLNRLLNACCYLLPYKLK